MTSTLHCSATEGCLFLDTPDACQKALQRMTPSMHLLNCLPAPHQILAVEESLEDHKVAGYATSSKWHTQLLRRPGQQLMIVKGGQHNSPPPTTRSDDDDDIALQSFYRIMALSPLCWFAPGWFTPHGLLALWLIPRPKGQSSQGANPKGHKARYFFTDGDCVRLMLQFRLLNSSNTLTPYYRRHVHGNRCGQHLTSEEPPRMTDRMSTSLDSHITSEECSR